MLALYDFAESIDVTVEFAPLRTRDGEYRNDLRRIRLREGLSERRTRWAFGHELGHAVLEHELLIFGLADPRQERAADEWAARFFIELDRFREVEEFRNGHVPSMAKDFGIVSRGITTYQRMLARLGDEVYLKPKHGVGQYAARLSA